MMRKATIITLALALSLTCRSQQQRWPDGTPMDKWFENITKVNVDHLGPKYVITDYGVTNDSTIVQTAHIQKVIDICSTNGGGIVVIPEGTFLSGALFFRQGTHLHVVGKLKGSDRIIDFPWMTTRIEGETCPYFCALVNADGLDGFTITGNGTIDGNGLSYWQEFWIRRKWDPQCTNKEAQRPRLTYISNSRNVTVQDVRLVNSPFWTNHVYKSDHVRYLDCYIYAPTENIWTEDPKRGAPSSDAIDIDACSDVLVKGCYMHVNDDAVVLKGGKGTWADKDSTNGPCERILIEDCTYGKVHGCLTLGSESLHDRNVILRRCHVANATRVLWLKMRPDTPQHYEYVTVEDLTGQTGSFLVVRPWTQFFKPQQRDDMPLSQCNDITMRQIKMTCKNFFDVGTSDKYKLTRFNYEDIDVQDQTNNFDPRLIEATSIRNVKINGKTIKPDHGAPSRTGVLGLLKKIGTKIDSMTVKGLDPRYIEAPKRPWQIIVRGNISQTIVNMKTQGTVLDTEYDTNTRLKTIPSQYIGLWVGYRGYGLGYTVNVGGDKGSLLTFGAT